MPSVDINLGLIFINALIFFILGLITEYLIEVNATKVISKILYIIIILGMYWIFLSSPIESTSEFTDVMTKFVYYFVNVILPFIIGEIFGDVIGEYYNRFKSVL